MEKMINFMNIFSPSTSNIFFVAAMAGFAGLCIGYLIKSVMLKKQKRRILSLEEEMLSNHSRILDLEKRLAEVKEENAKLKGSASVPAVELKIS